MDDTTPMDTFGARLRDRRVAAGLNQTELAKRAQALWPGHSCSQGAVSDWETGRATPSVGWLAPLASALSCNVTDLVPPVASAGQAA